MLKIHELLDEAKCYAAIRQIRWPQGVRCVYCQSARCSKDGYHTNQPLRQRYRCQACERRFDDLSETVLGGHHKSVTIWVLCLYFMGLNLSNRQIAQELELNKDDAQQMTTCLRTEIHERRDHPCLSGTVECDEVYIVAGHKGHPAAVVAAGREGRPRRLKGQRGRGTLAQEKPPVLGIIQRRGQLVLALLPNVQQRTIQPLLQTTIQPGTTIMTDEYNIYGRLTEWGYVHQTVNHSQGEYARDQDGDGFHEIHTNTIEGVWSLLRSWLRPHRGISQEHLPFYLACFEFIHNIRRRGKALLPSLLHLIL